jgi:uncharacterized OB-fold protein
MKTMKMTFVGAVLAVAGMATAATSADSVVGTWTLNTAKSTFEPGREVKSETRTYQEDADGTTVSVSGVAADGTAISQQSTFKYDGKAYPWSGSADFDALSLKRVNGTTATAVLMKAGKKVGTATRTISGHGKILTLSTSATGADGRSVKTKMIFDKQ